MTHVFRKESFRPDWHLQAHHAQHMMKLDVRSLELERRAEADGNKGQAEEEEQQLEHLKDF